MFCEGLIFFHGVQRNFYRVELQKLFLNERGRRVQSVPKRTMLVKLSLQARNMSYRRGSGSCGILTSDIRLTNKIEWFCMCLISPIRGLVLTFNTVFEESFVFSPEH